MLFILFFFSTEVPPGVHNGVVHSWFYIDSTVASFPGSPPTRRGGGDREEGRGSLETRLIVLQVSQTISVSGSVNNTISHQLLSCQVTNALHTAGFC